ncbi:putative inorganic phosphate cotransporter [Schistocerca cancellata]|uniref:putative inorganic phosphate cotransporter n=1 Tax=Schistocerca cancellata TaxID=274614 RepID=UPI0021189DDC|nr:putative inorganic phosphate cotransporter [Schistocerca cancellata]
MTSSNTARKESTLIPLRAAVAILGFLGIAFQYVLKVTLSVAIGGMVKQTAQDDATDNTCGPAGANTTSGVSQPGDFEWDEDMQGYILSSYYYGYAPVNIIAGYTASRYSARWVYCTGLLMAGLFSVLGPLAAEGGPVVFMLTRIIVGIFSGIITPSMHVIFGRWFPENERQRLSGFIFSANYLGTVLSMALSGTMVKSLGWPSVFYIFGGITISLTIPWLYFVYSEPESHPRISQKELDYILENTGHSKKTNDEKKKLPDDEESKIGNPWPMILSNPPMWAHCFVMFGIGWVNYTLLSELPTYMEKILHYDLDQAGLVSALPYLFGWISCSIYGYLTRKCTQKGVRIITTMRVWDAVACIGTPLFLLGVTLANCNVTAIIALFVMTMVARCAIYGGSYMNHLYLFPESYGSAAGLALTSTNIPGIITPIVTSAFVSGRQTIQQWKYVFYTSMAVCAIPYVTFLIFGTADEQESKWLERKEQKRKPAHITDLPVTNSV